MKYSKTIEFRHPSGKVVMGSITATPREGPDTRFQLHVLSHDPFVEKSYVSDASNLEEDIKDLKKKWRVAVSKQLIEFMSDEKDLLKRLGFKQLK